MARNEKKSFVKGAVILGVAGLICKVIGAFFRIPLYNMLGDGMQYYEAVYPYYSTLLVISTAGLPTAISRMVAERTALGRRRRRKARVSPFPVIAARHRRCYDGVDVFRRGLSGAHHGRPARSAVVSRHVSVAFDRLYAVLVSRISAGTAADDGHRNVAACRTDREADYRSVSCVAVDVPRAGIRRDGCGRWRNNFRTARR